MHPGRFNRRKRSHVSFLDVNNLVSPRSSVPSYHVCTQGNKQDEKSFLHSKLGKCFIPLSFCPTGSAHPLPPTPCTNENRGVENIIRERGAVPATVAILKGRPHVGLSASQLESLAEAGPRARKCSRRDLAVAMAQVRIYISVHVLALWMAVNAHDGCLF